ncbi:hypothetical protein PACTADRAFT_48891 [Pachysolen tannophilus NRRL Y-2460]|uniref:Protein SYM1 n=1 Tax=Pachysolen tannophilus NRRL Y-2460 TaxID=669874 RepID=A0A1E4TZH4_PACTA|nr:hypothetical protein PACTADRAFT_48891 [Pachysolen tannophilus NRRL Y-2460]
MSKFLKFYESSVQRKPLLTNSLTTAFLFGSGDAIAQLFFTENKPFPSSDAPKPSILAHYDYHRTLRAIIYGGAIFSFIGDKWYKFLPKIKFPSKKINNNRLNSIRDTITRVIVDQTVFAPIGIPLYYSCMSIMEGQSFEKWQENLKLNFLPTLLTNWAVWPFFQFLNFSLIPVQHRLLSVNIVSIAWNCFLSVRNAKGNVKEPDSTSHPVYFPPVPE